MARPEDCPVDPAFACPADMTQPHIIRERGSSDIEHIERHLGLVLERIDQIPAGIEDAVSRGVQQGVRALAEDPEFGSQFWRAGFEHLTQHAGKASSQWVGQRILTLFVIAVVSAGIGWLVRTGKL